MPTVSETHHAVRSASQLARIMLRVAVPNRDLAWFEIWFLNLEVLAFSVHEYHVMWMQGPRQWARGSNGVPPLGVEIHEKATYWLLII